MGRVIGVIGAGGWGTALAKLLAEKEHDVTLWCHGEQSFRDIRQDKENPAYLRGIKLPSAIKATRLLDEAVQKKDALFLAVPSHYFRAVVGAAATAVDAKSILVCATKGIDETKLAPMGEVLKEIFGAGQKERHAFLSGPTFALEVARGQPAAVTVAALDDRVGRAVQDMLGGPNFRVYTSRDIIGVEMGGVVKNVIAIAAGISDGLGLGLNARAALVTRGLAEMTRLAVKMGADPLTLSGLPGLGDLVLTATGDLSRNRSVGLEIARGKKLDEITRGTRTIAEGITNTRSVYLLAQKLGVETPIVEQMHRVLHEGKNPLEAVKELMQRTLKAELA
ncbi:MAG TPA: NAD(P)H-dependent glycerol-3-phosphate dehydrogenase [Candidatus Binatia bacterium]|jgi:glycerol-3-phosphate dehydrogenase (NAD(P)+)